jgi:hypothetical protein
LPAPSGARRTAAGFAPSSHGFRALPPALRSAPRVCTRG